MALYRKYRPASFAEVVGQEHVTEPLSVALSSGRINHAYLFSGPRGCGKTSSARILARSLNCVHGPTATPCGECDSCVALAPGGTGTLDVTELDAASHGGVDDTRDLRERAFFAPASSRYRVLIIDEAHMVTNAGFNALLKIVEEPPEHLIFIFATTEPEKVLPTIRSRTHHYPFRLLTPSSMRSLVERISEQEGVTVDPAVFPLVIRAGGGSPRDTLSVLDQLMAGAGDQGITYPRAVSLLGATEVALIDDTVDALAVGDGATLFRTVDKVVEAGHDPRRFAADLLQRLRDLIMVQSVPQAIERGLVDAPVEQADTMRRQAENIGPATLARCADMVHEGMGSMRGATSPRLLLEILCAKLLLPSADDSIAALLQRVESLESGSARPVAAPVAAGGGDAPGGAPQSDDDDNARSGPAGPPAAQGAPQPESRPKFVRRSQRQEAESAAQQAPPAPAQPAAGPAQVAPSAPITGHVAQPAAATAQPAPTTGQPAAAPGHVAQPASGPGQSAPVPAQPAPAAPTVVSDPAASVMPGESVAHQQAAAQQHPEPPAPASDERPAPPTVSAVSAADEPQDTPTHTGGERQQAPASTSGEGQEHAAPEGAPGDSREDSRAPVPSAAAGPAAGPAPAAEQAHDRPASAERTVSPTRPDTAAPSQSSAPQEQPRTPQPAAAQERPPQQPDQPEDPWAAPRAEPAAASGPAAGPAPARSEQPRAAQAAPAATGPETPPPTQAGPAPSESGSQPPAEAAPAAAHGIEAEDIRRAWPAIRDAVRTRTRTVEVMLAGAAVAGVDGRVIHLVHDYAPLAKRLSQPHNATVITDSVTEVVGGDWTIRCTSGGVPQTAGTDAAAPSPAAGPAPGQAGAAAAPQQNEPQGWQRRLRGTEAGQGQAGGRPGGGTPGGGYDDIPPPPEEPEPEPGEPNSPPPPPPPVSEDEMVDEARSSGPQNLDHRTGEDLALALLKEHLGARPLEG